MNYRELIELAAKAANITGLFDEYAGCFVPFEGRLSWNPLTDDGDAFRLSTSLLMIVDVGLTSTSVVRATPTVNGYKTHIALDICVPFDEHGIEFATRLAITLAAAKVTSIITKEPQK